jgi:hypothetical protein
VSMWYQKSPTLKVLCMHFHKNSRVKRCKVIDRIDLQMVSSHRGHAPPLKFHKPQTLMNGGLLAYWWLGEIAACFPRVHV